MASIKDVAKDAGVSVATVSYVCNKTKYVSPELTARVNASINRLGYRVNPVARNLRKRQSNVIGVVLQNIRNIFFPQLLAGMEEYARNQGVSLMFFNTYDDIAIETRAISTLSDLWVDGILLDSCVRERDAADYIDSINGGDRGGRKLPIVLLERNLGSHRNSAVTIHNFSAAYDATHHLIERGRRHIGHLPGNQEWSMSIDRQKGYEAAMRDFGFGGEILLGNGGFRAEDGFLAMNALLASGVPVDGVFAVNDQMAVGAMKAIIRAGLRIPDDIAVVGFDNVFVAGVVSPALTTVNVPKYTMGKEAARLLFNAIQNPDSAPETLTLPYEILIRGSTDAAVLADWDLAGW